MNITEFDSRLQKILEQWTQVEESIKRAELFESQVVIPAINELRYAGRSIVRALAKRDGEGNIDCEKELSIAEQYLYNADHDVVDSIVVYIGQNVSSLNLKFGRKAIESQVDRYKQLNDLLEQCRRSIESSRKSLIMERLEIYRKLKEDMPLLMDLFNDFVASDVIMATQVGKYEADIGALRRLATIFMWALFISIALNVLMIVHHIF